MVSSFHGVPLASRNGQCPYPLWAVPNYQLWKGLQVMRREGTGRPESKAQPAQASTSTIKQTFKPSNGTLTLAFRTRTTSLAASAPANSSSTSLNLNYRVNTHTYSTAAVRYRTDAAAAVGADRGCAVAAMGPAGAEHSAPRASAGCQRGVLGHSSTPWLRCFALTSYCTLDTSRTYDTHQLP